MDFGSLQARKIKTAFPQKRRKIQNNADIFLSAVSFQALYLPNLV